MAKAKTTLQPEVTIHRRTALGTRAVSRLRRQGSVPGVVYGKDTPPMAVAADRRELAKVLQSKAGEHALVTLSLTDGEPWKQPALIHAVHHDPVDGHVLHVDFHVILLTDRIKVKIPVALRNEPVGVREQGGILEQFLREVEVECLPTEIPSQVECDVAAMTIGETVHVRDLTPPSGERITSDPEGAIASVQAPKAEKPPEEAAPVTEPEVIREKKEEGGEATVEGEAKKGEPKPAREKDAKPREKDATS